MSKARDTRKDTKKKPAKSLLEKRAAKREKKAGRRFAFDGSSWMTPADRQP